MNCKSFKLIENITKKTADAETTKLDNLRLEKLCNP